MANRNVKKVMRKILAIDNKKDAKVVTKELARTNPIASEKAHRILSKRLGL